VAINTGLILVEAVLARRTFAVFFAIGIMIVIGDLSQHVFQNSFAFAAALTLLGFALIGSGVW